MCFLFVRLKKLFFIFKLILSVIFADTVKMLLLFHYKFELNHLPEMGGLFLPHTPISNCYIFWFSIFDSVWFSVLLQRPLYFSLLLTGLEMNMIYMLENNCTLSMVVIKLLVLLFFFRLKCFKLTLFLNIFYSKLFQLEIFWRNRCRSSDSSSYKENE